MLRFRSRAVTLMAADHQSSSAPTSQKPNTKQIPSLLTSPRLRALFVTRADNSDQPEAAPVALIPTSILDTNKPFSAALGSPIWYDVSSNYVGDSVSSPTCREIFDSRVVGLYSLILDNSGDPKPKDRCLISKFRLNLKVQIPLLPNSPTDFGTKTWNSPKLPQQLPGFAEDVIPNPEPSCLSMRGMELSEDYTCVISHGLNPTTTHIFENRVVESCLFYLSDLSRRLLILRSNLSHQRVFLARVSVARRASCRIKTFTFTEEIKLFAAAIADTRRWYSTARRMKKKMRIITPIN